MEETRFPLISPCIQKKLKFKRLPSQPSHHNYTQNIIGLPNHHINLIQEINKSKTKIQNKIAVSKSGELATLRDAINHNQNFGKKLKLMIYRSKNPELIAVVSQKKKNKIPRFDSRKQTIGQQSVAIENLKRKTQPKWKLYTRKRRQSNISLRDSCNRYQDDSFRSVSTPYQIPLV